MGAGPARDRLVAPARAGQNAVASAAAPGTPPRPTSAQAERVAAARGANWGGRSVRRAPRSRRTHALRNAARPFRSAAEVLLFILMGVPLAWSGRRKGLRTSLGLGAAGLAAVVFLAPLAWAGRWHPCAAAEVALVDGAVGRGSRFEGSKERVANWAGPDGKLLSRGRVGRQIAAEEHAGWPPFAGCAALFWRVRAEGASFGGFTAVLVRALSARR